MASLTSRDPGVPYAFSSYLDFLRLACAVAVALTHLKLLAIGPEWLRHAIPGIGHEFVVVFFVLSGYVIALAVDRKPDATLKDYALDRCARVLSVTIPTLLVAAAASLFLLVMYGDRVAGSVSDIVSGFALNLVFLGQSWGLFNTPPSDPPFWSLCYEVMYYALFGCVCYLRGRRRLVALGMVAVIAGPKILLLLPCWLAGVAAYRVRSATLEQRHWALALAVVPLLLAALLSHWHFGAALHAGIQHAGSEVPWLGRSNEFLKDYVTSVLVAAHLYGVRYLGIKFPVRLARAIAAGASLTFTLYLLHFPVLLVFKHVLGSRSSSVWSAVLAVLMVALGTWLLGTYTETRRVQLRRLLARYTSPILKPTRPAPV